MSLSKKKDEAVRVVVRCRPMSSKEIAENHESITTIHNKRGVIEIRNPSKVDGKARDDRLDWNLGSSSPVNTI